MGQKFYSVMDLNDVRIVRLAEGTADDEAVNTGQLTSAVNSAIANHETKPDPHPQYATDADLAAHTAAADPHPQYLTQAEADARYAPAPVPEEVIVGTVMPLDLNTNLWVNTAPDADLGTYSARLRALEADVARILAMLEEMR